MARTRTRPRDPAEHLESEEGHGGLPGGRPGGRGSGGRCCRPGATSPVPRESPRFARETGLGRESLYKGLSAEGKCRREAGRGSGSASSSWPTCLAETRDREEELARMTFEE